MNKHYIAGFLTLILLLSSLLILPTYASSNNRIITPDVRKIAPALRALIYEGKSIEGLAIHGDVIKGKVVVTDEYLDTALKYVKPYLVLPLNDGYLLFGYYRLSDVEKLASIGGVKAIVADTQPFFGLPEAPDEYLTANEALPTLYKIRSVIKADLVEDVYGYTGDGVVVAVIDTGIDYAQPNIRNKLITDEFGNPLVLDADALGLIYPTYEFTAENGYLKTANVTVTIFTGIIWWQDILYGTEYYSWLNYTIPADYYVGDIQSQSGVYKLGFQVNYLFGKIIPVLLVDSEEPGVYDTVYVDVSSVYKTKYLGLEPDYSFADEHPYKKGDVIAEDYTGDGIPDISMGVVGAYFLDSLLLFGGGFKEGFPTSGDYVVLFYDFYGHGTACASSIASEGILGFNIYGGNETYTLTGIAKNAKILGIQALFNGFVEAGWFFAAGFDTVSVNGLPVLVYSGKTRADLTSNSFGISFYIYDYFVFGADFESILEDILSIPGYLDPEYPGILMVQAGGNGGPGYGTITSPGASSLALTVGASTSFHWVRIQTPLPIFFDAEEGFTDNVIFWSLRGPTPLGEVKPDVVNIGAFGWVPGFIAAGGGDGSNSWSFFGGTSMATPLTAGVAALLIEALRDNGLQYDPQVLKRIIMNTAVDINYPAFIQGAGRVDAFNAVTSIVNGSVQAYSTDSWINIASSDFLFGSWLYYFMDYPVLVPLASGSLFEGYLLPGDNVTGTIYLENTYNMTVNVSIHDYYLLKTETEYYNFTSTIEENYEVVFMKVFDPSEFENIDFVTIHLYFNYSMFDPYNVYWYTTYHALVFGEWVDIDGDGELEDGEFLRMNYAYARANVQELTLNNPYQMMVDPENDKLVLYVYRSGPYPPSIPVTIKLTKYVKVDNPYIETVSSVTLNAGEVKTTLFELSVPEDALPGIYSAFIELTTEYGDSILMPISWSVVYLVTSPTFTIGGIEPSDLEPYDQYSTMGRQQWGWRYESGDWRIFHILVPPEFTAISMMEVTLEWQHPDSGFDFYVHSPCGMLVGGGVESVFYIGAGRIIWHTTLNQTATRFYAYPPLDLSLTDYGLYILSIRNYQYGGLIPAETYKVTVKMKLGNFMIAKPGLSVTSYMIEGSKDNPIYSALYMVGMPSVIIDVIPLAGNLSIYTIPAELPNYLYGNVSVVVSVIRPSPEVMAYARHIVMCYRPMYLIMRIYNVFMPIEAYHLETYETLIFAI